MRESMSEPIQPATIRFARPPYNNVGSRHVCVRLVVCEAPSPRCLLTSRAQREGSRCAPPCPAHSAVTQPPCGFRASSADAVRGEAGGHAWTTR
ncbi:hypothetical protein SRHO_G00015440 [Serrasalmus rhombeus]